MGFVIWEVAWLVWKLLLLGLFIPIKIGDFRGWFMALGLLHCHWLDLHCCFTVLNNLQSPLGCWWFSVRIIHFIWILKPVPHRALSSLPVSSLAPFFLSPYETIWNLLFPCLKTDKAVERANHGWSCKPVFSTTATLGRPSHKTWVQWHVRKTTSA